MVLYTCFRCGYNTIYKNNFKNHLNRKYICQPKNGDISIYEMKEFYKINIKHKNTQKRTKNKGTHKHKKTHINTKKYTKNHTL